MLKLAVTGGIACGKSRVGAFLREMNVAVCDCDSIAHDVMRRGSSVFDQVVDEFGSDLLDERGEIDRDRLGDIVFSSSEQRGILNGIVHPHVKAGWEQWLKQIDEPVLAATVIVPLLFEGGFEEGWDRVVCVAAPLEKQLQRLAKRGFGEPEARRRISAQYDVTEKMKRSDVVLYNAGSLDGLRKQTERALKLVLES
ncbi:MAG: dephospho-CoA kinase [Lentisphaerales bacterium]|jgi:dephospho-CoA kinase|nr:MAG: dephospho-CoA kinase [Lentisphaerales bacterium]